LHEPSERLSVEINETETLWISLANVVHDVHTELRITSSFLHLSRLQPQIRAACRTTRGLDFDDAAVALHVGGRILTSSVARKSSTTPLVVDDERDGRVLDRPVTHELAGR
jgi:hypothetical protein